MSSEVLLAAFTFGAILLVIALLGGGFEIFGAKIEAQVKRPERITAGIIGMIFILIGLLGQSLDNSGQRIATGNTTVLPTGSLTVSTTATVIPINASTKVPLPPPTKTSTPVVNTEPTFLPIPIQATAIREDLGLCQFSIPCSMPNSPGDNQVIVAHGDITSSGTCNIKIFISGQSLQGLGNSTFRLIRITGTPDQINAMVQDIKKSIDSPQGNCPEIE